MVRAVVRAAVAEAVVRAAAQEPRLRPGTGGGDTGAQDTNRQWPCECEWGMI